MHAHHLPARACARLVGVSLVFVLGTLVHVAPAAAQVPSLTAAALVADTINPGQTFDTAGLCDPAGFSTFTFEASGAASGGSMSGTFTETGTVTLGPAPLVGPQPVVAFEASFTIHTANGYTITGTKRLTATRGGICVPEGGTATPRVNFVLDVEYEAAITGPGGFFAVAGTATARGTDRAPSAADPDGQQQFQQTFITSTPIVLGPAALTLNPPVSAQAVETEHCVVATVRNVFDQPVASGTVRFAVSGVSSLTGSAEIASGAAAFCYVGPSEPGVDTIRAFADANGNGEEDPGEPADEVTVTFHAVERPPASLALDPATATHPVGADHCVTATVLDTTGAPAAGVRVRFTVDGEARPSGSAPTDADGTAGFCYTGPSDPGTDTIRAFADVDDDGVHDGGEPSALATATFEPVVRPAASLTVAPAAATPTVGSEHCVVATVRDASGGAADPVVVRFSVTGASSAGGSATTDAAGVAELCYTGPELPGTDAIRAFADTDGDGVEGAGEPADTAAATFVLPSSTPGCSATFGGRIDAGGDKATFAGTAVASSAGELRGQAGYHDHGAGLVVKSDEVLAVVCDAAARTATVYGTATLEGSSTAVYRIVVVDVTEPGAGADRYRLLLDTGYDSGERVLEGGNVQVRVS